jgi:hypothetical protein
MATWKTLVVVGAGFVLAACNGKSGGGGGTPEVDGGSEDGATSDSSMPGDGGTGDSSSKGDSSSAGDSGGSGGDGGAGDAGDGGTSCSGSGLDGGGLPYTGIVELSRVSNPTPVRYAALAQLEATSMAPPAGCTGMTVGDCCYENDATDAGIPTMESAGTITVSDGKGTLATMSFPSYVASNASDPKLTWAAGTMLTVTATGGTVGAFTATVTAPGAFAGLTPAFTAPVAVSLSKDFVVSWTAGKRPCSKVDLGLSQGTGLAHVACVVDDSAGTVTVPASLLEMFTAKSGSIVIERIEGTHVLATNADVGIGAFDVETTTTTYGP